MSESKWPSEEEVRKMFAKKEGFGSDATLSAAMELPEVRALVEAAMPYILPVQNADYSRQLRQHDALAAALAPFAAKKETP